MGFKGLKPGETRQSVRIFRIEHSLYTEMIWKFRFGDYKEYSVNNADDLYETFCKLDLFTDAFFIDGDRNVYR